MQDKVAARRRSDVPAVRMRAAVGSLALTLAFAAPVTLAGPLHAPHAVLGDATEQPAESGTDVGAPQETNGTREPDERETAPKEERNGKGHRRIRGSDPSADRSVMNA